MEPLNGDQEVLGEEDWNIPSCLIVKDIPKEVFESPVEKVIDIYLDMVCQFFLTFSLNYHKFNQDSQDLLPSLANFTFTFLNISVLNIYF